jgi:A/G-specific adenine glycosylase
MKENTRQKTFFTASLTYWHHTANQRSLPWKQEKDPYKIWLSEVILQQTRAQQGLPYYQKFIQAFPTIKAMAKAADDDVFRLWQGLGYYNRCKNMLATARYITNDRGGKFPVNYDDLLALKGVGAYTAAAIASFAYGAPHAVVDGNVYRVLARYFGIETAFDTTEGKKQFQALAQQLLDTKDSATYNQAIMDLGATVCTPAAPLCDTCPLQKHCFAHHKNMIADLPVRSKKQVVKKRYFHYILILANDTLWIHKRTDKDIWQNLHEPLLIEHSSAMDSKWVATELKKLSISISANDINYEGLMTQKLTHRLIESHFFVVKMKNTLKINIENGQWVKCHELKKIAFPKTIIAFLKRNLYF